MKKVLHTLCLLALLVPMRISAQNTASAAMEPIPDGEKHPERIMAENSVLDAVLLIEAGEPDAARAILDSLDAAGSGDAAVQYYLGMLSLPSLSAVPRFEKAAQLDSTNLWYKETLANIYVSAGEAAKAGEIFTDLSKTNPVKFHNVYTLSLMADAYRMKRDYPSFFSVLAEIVEDPDTEDETKYQTIMASIGGFDPRTFNTILPGIDSLMQRYTVAEPSSIHAHSLRMEIAALRKDHDTVIAECRKMIELQPDDPQAIVTNLSIIGDTQHEMGDSKAAYKTYEQALKLDPENCAVLNNYAYFLSQDKRCLSKAEKMSRITIEKEPDNATYLDTYGWILYLRGKPQKAQPYFKHAMIYGGKESAVVLMHYSIVLSALGNDDLAEYYRNLAEKKTK